MEMLEALKSFSSGSYGKLNPGDKFSVNNIRAAVLKSKKLAQTAPKKQTRPKENKMEPEPKKNKENKEDYPKKTSPKSNWYELSSGKKILGKQKAIEAEAELKGSE